jgi:hypothetical protein
MRRVVIRTGISLRCTPSGGRRSPASAARSPDAHRDHFHRTSSSSLRILDEQRRGHGLNLIWGHAGDGHGTPRGRADVLLTQNGYRRIGDWQRTPEGDAAPVEATGHTTRCSCWQHNGRLVDVDYWCHDHPILRHRES